MQKFLDTLSSRLKDKFFLLNLFFSLFYFLFQILFRTTADFLNDAYYVDKIAHASFGYLLFSFWFFFMTKYKLGKFKAAAASFVFVVGIGILKELLDFSRTTGSGIFSIQDIVASLFGIVIFLAINWKRAMKR